MMNFLPGDLDPKSATAPEVAPPKKPELQGGLPLPHTGSLDWQKTFNMPPSRLEKGEETPRFGDPRFCNNQNGLAGSMAGSLAPANRERERET